MLDMIPRDMGMKEVWKPKPKDIIRYFIYYFIPLFIGITLLLFGLVIGDYYRSSSLIHANETLHINILKKTLIRDLEDIGPDLRLLIQNDNFHEYLEYESSEAKHELSTIFSLLAVHKRRYDQIRFIDNNGMEKVRIDFINGVPVQVPTQQLQNKSDRYYFQDAIALNRGQVFVSPLDLNVERGKVEIPHKPMIRFATPVFDHSGNKRGVIVINYLAKRMLDHFDEMLEGSMGRIDFLNSDGFWIRSENTSRNWGFMLGNPERFQDTFPDLWSTVYGNEKGRVEQSENLINYATVSADATVEESIENIPEFDHIVHQTHDHMWKIISIVPKDVLINQVVEKLVYITGPVWSLLVLGLIVGCWNAAKAEIYHQKLRLESELHARVFSWTTEGVSITDPQARIIDVNSAFTRITGYELNDVLGKTSAILSSGKHDAAYYARMWSDITTKGFWEGEIYNRRKDGGLYCEWLRIAAAFDRNKRVLNYIAVFSDITQRKESEENLVRRAHKDPLTGLSNRFVMDEFLSLEISRANRSGHRVACVYVDLNDFKPINDNYGHHVGDAVLCEISTRLKEHARETDKVARLGGR